MGLFFFSRKGGETRQARRKRDADLPLKRR